MNPFSPEYDAEIDNAIESSVERIWRECQDKGNWISEWHRKETIRQWTPDFKRAGLPIPR